MKEIEVSINWLSIKNINPNLQDKYLNQLYLEIYFGSNRVRSKSIGIYSNAKIAISIYFYIIKSN